MKQIIVCKSKKLLTSEAKILDQIEKIDYLETTEINDLSKAYSLISILPELDLVIIIPEENQIKEILTIEKKMDEALSEVPMIIVGNMSGKRDRSYQLPVLTFESLKEKIEEVLSIKSISQKSENEYVPVRFNFIAENLDRPFPVDFYFRVHHMDGQYQFVKRLSKDSSFTKDEIEKYKHHSLENIFVSKNEYLSFIKFSKELILEKIKSSTDAISVQKIIDYSYHISAESLAMFGISEQNVALLNENISKMEAEISKDSALSNFIKFMKSSKHSYAYAHSYLLSLFISKIAAMNNWDSKAVREKICYISFFHDIVLKDDELCKVHGEAEFAKLNGEHLNVVKNHASIAAEILEKLPQVPTGVAQIVKEHHGMKNGIGFHDGVNPTLQPLSVIFIVVEDFITLFLKLPAPTADAVMKIISVLKNKYPSGNYQKAVIGLENFLGQ